MAVKISGQLIWLQYLNRTNIHKYPLFKIIPKIFLRMSNCQLKIPMRMNAIQMKCELSRSEKWEEKFTLVTRYHYHCRGYS